LRNQYSLVITQHNKIRNTKMEVPPNVYAKNEAQNAKPDLNKHATTQPM